MRRIDKKQEPDIDDSLDVNLRAPILFSRIASVYLRQQSPNQDGDSATTTEGAAAVNKSLTLVSSVAGFTEAPGLAVYSAGKHGVYGLMRALRKYVFASLLLIPSFLPSLHPSHPHQPFVSHNPTNCQQKTESSSNHPIQSAQTQSAPG